MTLKRFLSTTLAATAIAGAGLAGVSAHGAEAANASTCPSGTWDTTTAGVPVFDAHLDGVAVFRDSAHPNVFHVRMSTTRAKAVYSGAVTTNGVLAVQSVRTERGDVVRKTGPGSMVFSMTNVGHVDGFDVVIGCASKVHVGVARGTAKLPATSIFLGATKSHPATNPFTVSKS